MESGVVTKQPGQQEMAMFASLGDKIPGCPEGLECLASINELIIKQNVLLQEVFCVTCQTNNEYRIVNTSKQEVLSVVENTPCCTRCCCGVLRAFDIQIHDKNQREVIHLQRPCRGQGCFFPCFLQEMTVTAPAAGTILGFVKEEWTILVPQFVIQNSNQEDVFRITGPILHCSFGQDIIFNIYKADGTTQIGSIQKRWSGLLRECCTDTDFFKIIFPLELEPGYKGLLLGALFCIEYMYYEYPRNWCLCN